MAYRAVHPVESWEDLRNRLDYDRRYFAFFHPRRIEENHEAYRGRGREAASSTGRGSLRGL